MEKNRIDGMVNLLKEMLHPAPIILCSIIPVWRMEKNTYEKGIFCWFVNSVSPCLKMNRDCCLTWKHKISLYFGVNWKHCKSHLAKKIKVMQKFEVKWLSQLFLIVLQRSRIVLFLNAGQFFKSLQKACGFSLIFTSHWHLQLWRHPTRALQ